MGVRIAEGSIAAFIALIVAALLIGLVFYARRRGHPVGRGGLLAIAAIVFLLVAYGMTGGVPPVSPNVADHE
jgi:hypothetical protein